jgi:hypothetical protein
MGRVGKGKLRTKIKHEWWEKVGDGARVWNIYLLKDGTVVE